MAPEVFNGLYGKEADIWSIGMTAYYLLTREFPFSTAGRWEDVAENVRTFQLEFPREQGWSSRRLRPARDLIRALLAVDVTVRLTAPQALRSEFIVRHAPAPGLGWRGYSKKLVEGFPGYAAAPNVLRVLLLVTACQMDQTQMGKMKRQFMDIDADGDGFITRDDLAKLLQHRSTGSDPVELLHIADIDGDGAIGFTEFVAAWLYGRLGEDKECVRHAFELLDSDSDGLVSREDILRGLNTKQLGELGGSRSLAEDVADVFPTGKRLDCRSFVEQLTMHEPMRVGFRYKRPRRTRGCCVHLISSTESVRRVATMTGSSRSVRYESDDSDMEDSEVTSDSDDSDET
jgi:calcium-dependent protein kinase